MFLSETEKQSSKKKKKLVVTQIKNWMLKLQAFICFSKLIVTELNVSQMLELTLKQYLLNT